MNNETQHTPGPWRFSKVGYGEGLCYHIQTVDMSHRNTFIGEAGGGLQSDDEITANAALIASAPSLLKENEKLNEECVLLTGSIRELSSSNDALVKENQELKEGMNEVIGWRNKVMEMNAELKSINAELIKMRDLSQKSFDIIRKMSDNLSQHKDFEKIFNLCTEVLEALSKSKTEKP